MSTIFNQLVKIRIEQFNKCKPDGAGKHDVKPGEVIIQELHPTPVGINGETMFCDANWRPHSYAPFFDGQTFRMNTDVLYNNASSSRHKLTTQPQNLVGELVHVSDPAISYQLDRNNKTVKKFNVQWGVINKEPEIVTPKTAGIYLLTNTGPTKPKTLGEAVENFYAQSDESLRLAAYYEGYLSDDEFDWHQPQEEYYDDDELSSDDLQVNNK